VKRALVICLLIAGCKSGAGERCQVKEDCEDGLVCNKAKNTCQTTMGGDLDAAVPEMPPADAAIDGPPADAP
jgi:hypothetical protein